MVSELISGDERRASWKVLLPSIPKNRILVLGGGIWLVQSLARSYAGVDWLFDEQRCDLDTGSKREPSFSGEQFNLLNSLDDSTVSYDVIVIADKKWSSSSAFRTIDTFLKPEGILVQVGLSFRPWSRKILARWGLNHYHFLSALPVSAPRLFFPLFPSEFCQLSLSFHAPGSRKARFGVALLKWISRFGSKVLLGRRGIVFCSRENFQGRPGTLALWLSEKLSLRIDNIAVYCGSDSPRRKMTLLVGAVGSDARPVSLVVKVADTEAGAYAIRQESVILRYLECHKVECEYPRLLHEGHWYNQTVQVQQSLFSEDGFSVSKLGGEHLSALTSFSRMARETIAISETREWQRVNEVWQGGKDSFPPALQSLWESCLARVDKLGDKIPVHFVHGDFTSWNMRCQKGRLAIFDWEDSLFRGLPFYDLFRFVYRQASLIGPWPGGDKFYSLLSEKLEYLERMANYDSSVAERVVPLLIVYEYLERPHSDLLDFAVFF